MTIQSIVDRIVTDFPEINPAEARQRVRDSIISVYTTLTVLESTMPTAFALASGASVGIACIRGDLSLGHCGHTELTGTPIDIEFTHGELTLGRSERTPT